MPIVWTFPDGHVEIEYLVQSYLEHNRQPGETTDQAVARLAEQLKPKKGPRWAAATPTLVRTADIPNDRSRRHAWRLQGNRVVPDPAVPDPPKRPTIEDLEARIAALERRP